MTRVTLLATKCRGSRSKARVDRLPTRLNVSINSASSPARCGRWRSIYRRLSRRLQRRFLYDQKTPGSLWNQAILGYGPKDEVSDAVRKGVRAMVELFAATFASARADGGARVVSLVIEPSTAYRFVSVPPVLLPIAVESFSLSAGDVSNQLPLVDLVQRVARSYGGCLGCLFISPGADDSVGRVATSFPRTPSWLVCKS